MIEILYKSEVVDSIINAYETEMRKAKKHLLKTNTLLNAISGHIDLTDELAEREELLLIGIKQVLQSRLYAHGYFSINTGYFVNLAECTNLAYIKCLLDSKDSTLEVKRVARNRIKELKGLDGQLEFIPDDNNCLDITENKTKEELLEDMEADAV